MRNLCLYALMDTVANFVQQFFTAFNDNDAARRVNGAYHDSPVYEDIRLYRVASLDENTGAVTSCSPIEVSLRYNSEVDIDG